MFFFIISLTLSSVQAAKVALIVKNSTNLSNYHEKKISNILTTMGFDVTPIDKDSIVDYSQFDLIVVAGRPGNVYSYEHLDSFVANLPVNDIPTVAIDSSYPDDWGWILPVGISTLSSTETQKVKIINNSASITNGYSLGQMVEVHIIGGKTIIDLIGGKFKLTPIASVTTCDGNIVIAAAEAGTELYNNQTNKCRIVFFGITNPLFWTDDAISLFKNSINWTLTDTDHDSIIDCKDNCPLKYNPDQNDTDGDGVGDACDNCPLVYNPNQSDMNKNGIGDLCDPDIDGDKIPNNIDNCWFKYNPNQKDSNGNCPIQPYTTDPKCGNACEDLPYQVFMDVDNDSINETAINQNNITDDGFEVYSDSNHNTRAIPMDGDFDGMTDWLIDMQPYGTYDRYWDPDNGILTNVNRTGKDYYIDTNGDGKFDIIYNSLDNAFVVRRDVDSDSKLEEALDHNLNGSFDEYRDLDGSSMLLHIVDGDHDGKNDFIIGINNTKPAIYWDPDDNILTNITASDLNGDGKNEYLIDVNGDGKYEQIFNGNALHDLPDLTVDSILINQTSIMEGDNVEVTTRIKNIGGYDTNHFTIDFKVDENTIESKIISLPIGGSADLTFDWTAQRGSHTIEIIVDSNNTISESNEDNNIKSIGIAVSFYPSTNGGGGGGTNVILPGTAEFTGFPDKVEVEVGDKITVSGKFQNNLSYDLNNVIFSIQSEGLSPSFYSISPARYDKIVKNDKKDVSIEFNIPKDADIYSYIVTLKANADSQEGTKTYRQTFSLMLKEKIETTTTIVPETTTTIPETTTTIEEKPSPLTGFYAAISTYSIPIIIVIIIIVIVILLKVFKVRFKFVDGKKGYVYGKGWRAPTLKLKFFSISSLKSLFTKW
jgi:hypothetical protein